MDTDKAKVIYAPPEIFLPYGQPAVLDCHFRANPPLKNLRWEKDGLLFDSYNVPGVFYKMNGSLFFAKVDENHAGSYTCTPYNDLGTDGPSPIISVIVLRPPIFSVTPKAIYIQKLGEAAELPCEAIDRDGNNRPSIVWNRVSLLKECQCHFKSLKRQWQMLNWQGEVVGYGIYPKWLSVEGPSAVSHDCILNYACT